MWFFNKKISEDALIGVWKHPINAGGGSFEIKKSDGTTSNHPFVVYNFEIFHFRSNKTFTFGEYSNSGPLYEVQGRWKLSSDKKRIDFSYDNGDTYSMDIRNFNGKSFITTSAQGSDFLFTKEQ